MKSNVFFFLTLMYSLQAMDNPLVNLPLDLKKYLCTFFIVKEIKKTFSENCFQTMQAIRRFTFACKGLYTLRSNRSFIEYIISQMHDGQFKDYEFGKAVSALSLNTVAGDQYAKDVFIDNPAIKDKFYFARVEAATTTKKNAHYTYNLVKKFLAMGVLPNKNFSIPSILSLCLHIENDEILELLLRKCNLNRKDSCAGADTPLFRAAELDRSRTLSVLIKCGADINMRAGFYKNTPLIQACIFGRVDSVRLLLEANADRSQKNHEGLTAEEIIMRRFNLGDQHPSYGDTKQILELFEQYPENH